MVLGLITAISWLEESNYDNQYELISYLISNNLFRGKIENVVCKWALQKRRTSSSIIIRRPLGVGPRRSS
jgi:hypothetical protein